MHISGQHPLAWEYLGKVAEVSGGQGGFVVHSITTTTTATALRSSLALSATTSAR